MRVSNSTVMSEVSPEHFTQGFPTRMLPNRGIQQRRQLFSVAYAFLAEDLYSG